MSKRFKNIIQDVAGRWRETITSTAEPDLSGAVKLLHKATGKKLRIFTVTSPTELYIAQAVLRGRVSKKNAVKMAGDAGIDAEFVKPLTRLGSPRRVIVSPNRWRSTEQITNILTLVTDRQFQSHKPGAELAGIEMTTGPSARVNVQLQNLKELYSQLLPRPHYHTTSQAEKDAYNYRDWRLNFHGAHNHVTDSVMSLHDAVNGHMADILAGTLVPGWHKNDAIQAEIICTAMSCKDATAIWPYEIFHYVPAFMQFEDAYLLLAGKPAMQLGADGNLHNDTGPAVVWPDGKKFWYFDGHVLAQYGEKIVLNPHSLTKKEILDIANEEERRVAIDRMGWHKYLTAIDAKIAHSRENWVDNTFEVLIDPPGSRKNGFGREEPLRMVLSCRSTARKYFIAVPRELPNPNLSGGWATEEDLRKYPPIRVKTCEDAQKWLANGATTEYLDYAKHPINVVGAS